MLWPAPFVLFCFTLEVEVSLAYERVGRKGDELLVAQAVGRCGDIGLEVLSLYAGGGGLLARRNSPEGGS